MDNQTFSLYSSGVLLASFEILHNKILYQKLNRETLVWEEQKELTEDNREFVYPQEIPVFEVLQKTIHKVDAQGLGQNYTFHKHISCDAGGKQVQAAIYAQKAGSFPLDYVFLGDVIIGAIADLYKKESVLIQNGCEELTPLRYYQDSVLSKPIYGVKDMGAVMVRMRDGVRLSTQVILPCGEAETAKFPAVMIRTPYGKPRELPMHFFSHYGYAVVIQDTRGREDSEGEFDPMLDEVVDGEDTINWLCEQPWFNGCAGMIGGSYLGAVQWAIASTGHPALKAMISQVTGGTPFYDFPHRSGILLSGVLAWMFSMASKVRDPQQMNRTDWTEVLRSRPVRSIPERALGRKLPFWDKWMAHTVRDQYWNRGNWEANAAKIDVPTLHVSGWYDDASLGTCQFWHMNQKNKRANQKLIVGPWQHQYNTSRDIHGINFGTEAVRHDLFSVYLRWYDRFLKGIQNDAELLPAVSYFRIHENKWCEAEAWPLPETREQSMYLGGQEAGMTDGGILTPQTGTGMDTYAFDPQDPAPHLIDVCENECLVPENYREVEKRPDVLCYTTEPLREDTTIVGEPRAVIYAASDAVDTDFVVRLTEVYENGDSIRLSDGVVRARFRNSLEQETFLTPGEITEYAIPMTWIGVTIPKGNRLRVEVTSGMDNLIFANHNTGGNFSTDTEYIVVHQTIYHNEQYPSHIVLPVIPDKQ